MEQAYETHPPSWDRPILGRDVWPLGARSQLPLTSSFCALLLGPAAGSARPAGEKEPGVKRIADFLLSEDILLDVDVSSKSQLIDEIGRHMQQVHGWRSSRLQ